MHVTDNIASLNCKAAKFEKKSNWLVASKPWSNKFECYRYVKCVILTNVVVERDMLPELVITFCDIKYSLEFWMVLNQYSKPKSSSTFKFTSNYRYITIVDTFWPIIYKVWVNAVALLCTKTFPRYKVLSWLAILRN